MESTLSIKITGRRTGSKRFKIWGCEQLLTNLYIVRQPKDVLGVVVGDKTTEIFDKVLNYKTFLDTWCSLFSTI